MYNRWNIKKRIALCCILIMQILLVSVYFLTQNEHAEREERNELSIKNSVVKFIKDYNKSDNKTAQKIEGDNKISLKTASTESLYENFNTSLCYKQGTDLKAMKRSKGLKWKCACFTGWHGNDCGQPEVIWRALLAFKIYRPPSLRKYQRRIVHLSETNVIAKTFNEILIQELVNIVDLFIIVANENEHELKDKYKRLFREMYDKILFVSSTSINYAWRKALKYINGDKLKDDDIFLINYPYEIPNIQALTFLKLYNDWPEPLTFRLKWSVYGFFWKHPNKTTLVVRACTMKYLFAILNNDINLLGNNYLSTNVKSKQGFIIGDLNHFGGWFCEYCNEPANIITSLLSDKHEKVFTNDKVRKIDVAYIEDLIENGIYIDGKIQLERARKYNEKYYAPDIVKNNTWKYDWLMDNLYSRMDYY